MLGSVVAASLVSTGTSICWLRVAHPRVRLAYEVTFATLFSVGLACILFMGAAVAITRFKVEPQSTLVLMLASAVCLAGVWMSVGTSVIGTVYDIKVLHLPLARIKGRGWTWSMLPACITHVSYGLVAAALALVGEVVVQ